MKRLATTLLLLFALISPVGVLVGQSSAADIFENTCNSDGKISKTSVCQDVQNQQDSETNPIISIIRVAIEVISFLIGVAAVIGLVVSGIRFATASDSNGAASARNGAIYSLVGVAVAALAQGIVVFVLNRV
jgi:hypothetical protein